MTNTAKQNTLLIFFIVICCLRVTTANKTMVILAMVPKTGDMPRDGRSCMGAMQVVINAANMNPSILPDYNLQVQFEDEGGQAAIAPRSFIKFAQQFTNVNSTIFMAPIAVGTMFLCQTTSGIVRYFNMIQFTQGCVGTLYTENRRRFPNLYRVLIPAEMITLPMFYVVEKLGSWRQVAVISNSGNVNNDLAANVFYTVASNSQVEVVWFAGVQDIDSTIIDSLKQSDARAVAAFMVETPVVLKFICETYAQGLRAPRYVFIFQNRAFIDPETADLRLPLGCTREMLAEQLKISFFTGLANSALQNYGTTDLGYDLNAFEGLFNQVMKNSSRLPDFAQRHQCHDAMEGAILALHNAEVALRKSPLNLTLNDYPTRPEIIMNFVNKSAASSSFKGLRIGRIAYSKRLEIDQETMYVSQWQNRVMRTIGQVTFTGGNQSDGIYNFSLYNASVIAPIVWATRNGIPPKDLSMVRHFVVTRPAFVLPTIVACCSALSVIQSVSLCSLLFSMYAAVRPVKNTVADVSLVLGSVAMNLTAVLFAMDLGLPAVEICLFRIILPAVGMALVNGNIFFQQAVIAFEAKYKLKSLIRSSLSPFRTITHRWRSRGTSKKPNRADGNSTLAPTTTQSKRAVTTSANALKPSQVILSVESISNHKRAVSIGICVFLSLNMLVIVICLALSPSKIVSLTTSIDFDEEDDSYYDMRTDICSSPGQLYSLVVLTGLNATILVVGSCFAFQSRFVVVPDYHLSLHVKSVRYSTLNAMTLFVLGVFLVVVISPVNIALQSIALSFVALIYSASNWAILAAAQLKRGNHKNATNAATGNNAFPLSTNHRIAGNHSEHSTQRATPIPQ